MNHLDVGLALKNTPRGQLKYDLFWHRDGRTKEVLDEISEINKAKLSINLKNLDLLINDLSLEETEKDSQNEVPSSPTPAPSKKTNITDAHFYVLQSETENPILEYKEEKLKYFEDVFNGKKSEFDHYSNELEQQFKQEYLLFKRRKELDDKRKAADLEKIEKEIQEEATRKEMLLREQHQNHVKKLSLKIQEAEMKQKRAEEEMRKKQQEQIELNDQLNVFLKESQELAAKSIEKLTSCEHSSHLRVSREKRVEELTNILQAINVYVEQAKTKELNIDDIFNANLRVKDIYEVFQDICNDIEGAKSKALQSRRDKLSTFSFKQASENNAATLPVVQPSSSQSNANLEAQNNHAAQATQQSTTTNTSGIGSKVAVKKIISQFIAPDAADKFERITSNLKRVENLQQSLKTDPRHKKYRFELHKAINTPINSLSSNSGSEIKAKIHKLLAILAGKYPEMFQRDFSRDEAAYSFCAFLMAKQFVEQGYSQISAQYSTAYPIALAIIGVWSKKPDVGDLILGHFYSRCPYLVPFYPPRQQGQTDLEYRSSLGYHVDDEGQIEETHKFLNRMSGYTRLYAAIIVSPPPPDSPRHPHGVPHAWRWLARTLNLEPRPEVTATVLFDFLEVAGSALFRAYGKQFKKVIHIMCKDYFSKIRSSATPGSAMGPIERLETFLKQTANKGSIPPPQGFLDAGFWNRYG